MTKTLQWKRLATSKIKNGKNKITNIFIRFCRIISYILKKESLNFKYRLIFYTFLYGFMTKTLQWNRLDTSKVKNNKSRFTNIFIRFCKIIIYIPKKSLNFKYTLIFYKFLYCSMTNMCAMGQFRYF